jgi:DNA-directed RNA polymerase specialized sigma24 family protein
MRRRTVTLTELACVYRAEFRAFLRTATAYLGDVEAARDAVQEGVASAIRKRGSWRGDGTLEAWLWSVVLNAIRMHHRERAHTRMLAADEPDALAPTNGAGAPGIGERAHDPGHHLARRPEHRGSEVRRHAAGEELGGQLGIRRAAGIRQEARAVRL